MGLSAYAQGTWVVVILTIAGQAMGLVGTGHLVMGHLALPSLIS